MNVAHPPRCCSLASAWLSSFGVVQPFGVKTGIICNGRLACKKQPFHFNFKMRERDANWYPAKCSSTLVPFMAFFITTYFGFSTFPTENEQIVAETAPLIP